jgi:hypothetical protein
LVTTADRAGGWEHLQFQATPGSENQRGDLSLNAGRNAAIYVEGDVAVKADVPVPGTGPHALISLEIRNEVRKMSEQCDFGTFGRYEEIPVERMPPEMRDAYEFTEKLRGLVPGAHKIWLANPKLLKAVAPTAPTTRPNRP